MQRMLRARHKTRNLSADSPFRVSHMAWGSGCSFWTKKQTEKTPEIMYNDAMRLLNKKKYLQAAEGFWRFKEDFPLSPLTPMAELRTADALYLDKNYAEAIVHI